MSYDITFCEGHGCPRKDTCHHHLELLRFRTDKDPNRGDLIWLTKPTDPAKCTMYWEKLTDKTNKQ